MADWQEPKTPEEAFARSMEAIARLHERERDLVASIQAQREHLLEVMIERDGARVDARRAELLLREAQADNEALKAAIREAKADRDALRRLLAATFEAHGITPTERQAWLLDAHPYDHTEEAPDAHE